MLTIVISPPSCTSMMQVSSTASVTTVVKPASSYDMKYHCLFPLATVIPLIFPDLFSFRNIQYSKNSAFPVLVSPDWCLGLNMFRRWTCLISNFTDSLALFTHFFRPAFSEIYFIIVNTTIDCSSNAWLKNMCESGFNVPWFSICAIAVSYF